MESFYIVIVGVLFILAISDLIVGVSNDAVNFLNSAIGAKAAPFKVIMIVAAIGIFVGATFSSGMMEVARKGIFNPQHFYFSEIMIIFLAVMLTDIILLDTFNTLGMPTSTTVSIVFELLGAAVAISLVKIADPANTLAMGDYINTSKALAIISGILLSVVVAFSAGAIIQWLTRLLFSFNYVKKMKYLGAIFGGMAITAITYFMLIKGAKGASFMTLDAKAWINDNTLIIIGVSLITWTIILQVFFWFFKVNILKIIVLVGTFALAMAFAGNDLVNFIGVPLAGFESFKVFQASGALSPEKITMEALGGKVHTETYLLILAGLIMVVTLWTSRKARSVVQTSLDLSRQDEGEERFGSSFLARGIVRAANNFSHGIKSIVPASVQRGIEKQFDQTRYNMAIAQEENPPAFDMLRASVNLIVASILIAFATSLKLPLSTTYVTFMVAMGTSLADQAWGRESAVYRITGVMSVIGGWFLTALVAFTVAFLVARFIHWGGVIAIVVIIALAAYLVIRTYRLHRKKESEKALEKSAEQKIAAKKSLVKGDLVSTCTETVTDILRSEINLFTYTMEAFNEGNWRKLRECEKEAVNLNKKTKRLKNNAIKVVRKLEEQDMNSSLFYVQVLDYLRESAHCLTFVVEPSYQHLANHHKEFTTEQKDEIRGVSNELRIYISAIIESIEKADFQNLQGIQKEQSELMDHLDLLRRTQLKRLKREKLSTKASILYLNILNETRSLALHTLNITKSQRDLVAETNLQEKTPIVN